MIMVVDYARDLGRMALSSVPPQPTRVEGPIVIELDDIRRTRRRDRGEQVLLDGVDLHLDTGEVCGIVGESFDGPRTLLWCVNLLERPDEGTVRVAGEELTAMSSRRLRRARHGIGVLGPGDRLLEQRTVARNVSLPLEFAGVRQRERDLRVDEILDRVGLAEVADRWPSDLTAEERRRAAVARAFVTRPRVLLCQEPTGGLPGDVTRSLLTLVGDLIAEQKTTVVLATRDLAEVAALCESVALLQDGRVVERGTLPDTLTNPASKLANLFLPPLPDQDCEPATGAVLVDLTFTGDDPHALTDVARACGVDVSVVAGSLERLRGRTVGRLRVELTGAGEDCQRALDTFADLALSPKVHP
jgi:D-methionine transport system ATP-binding protein